MSVLSIIANNNTIKSDMLDCASENDVGYPISCLRTPQYLYIRNFKPNLWAAGNGDIFDSYEYCGVAPHSW